MPPPKVVFSPRDEPPVPVDALVEEEDTYLTLSAESVLQMPGEHPVRVMTAAREAKELEPGTVVVRDGRPVKLLAIVHRLHEDPSWQEEWIIGAIGKLCREVEARQIRALGMPLLGTVYGKMRPERALELMAPLRSVGLELLWIVRTSP